MYNFSYDIACQWHKKLWSRMLNLPECLQLNHADKIVRFFVPKFHLKVHVQTCQTQFSFNFTHWVGCTNREAPECGWANFNRVASSTKEMGPGRRRDHLDDHFGDSNWKKSIAMGKASFDYLLALILVMLAGQTMLRKLTEGCSGRNAIGENLMRLRRPSSLRNWSNASLTWQLGMKTRLGQN
jgi:predicted metal-binding protein